MHLLKRLPSRWTIFVKKWEVLFKSKANSGLGWEAISLDSVCRTGSQTLGTVQIVAIDTTLG